MDNRLCPERRIEQIGSFVASLNGRPQPEVSQWYSSHDNDVVDEVAS